MNMIFEAPPLRPTFWEEAACAAAELIEACQAKHPGLTPIEIRQEFDSVEKEFLRTPGAHMHLATMWARVGHAAMMYARNSGRGTFSAAELSEVLIKKQRDYGKHNILRYGTQGVLIRCHDKIARLENLVKLSSYTPANESVFDTLLDIAGYAAIAIMLDTFTFELPMEPLDMQSA